MIDARGHGQSDKPHDGASYALGSRVSDVMAVINAVGVERAHFWVTRWEDLSDSAWPSTHLRG
jgi:pimeloyl-ACP methyl ester carboxylesterase